ncbi:DUF4142 domain-containing protein [Mesorhizobium sp. BR1-1-16]|uniref:DUF4142 domain-containing protein n=1 Tax=Mesorhizobium sp. BR1-1-16 TaxID=2876653 RepID=UPI001CCC1D62|nr:DUF4142 domain-containing protein [Mesorhizobium sp. BR1-1-16]MBZ9936968.1 DUF4142 domain-containing protein [Mesorhizobium sp. BR1-1-16]
MRHILLAVVAYLMFLPAGVASAQAPAPGDAEAFVNEATQDGLLELAIARLAVAKTEDSDILRYGNYVVQVFNDANQAIASAAGDIEPPRSLDQSRQSLHDMLQGTPQATFKETYLRLQRQTLDTTLMTYTAYAQNGPSGALRDAARSFVDDIKRLSDALQKVPTAQQR